MVVCWAEAVVVLAYIWHTSCRVWVAVVVVYGIGTTTITLVCQIDASATNASAHTINNDTTNDITNATTIDTTNHTTTEITNDTTNATTNDSTNGLTNVTTTGNTTAADMCSLGCGMSGKAIFSSVESMGNAV